VFQDVSSKSVGLTREASALLSNGSSASAHLGCYLSGHAELLSSKAEPPLVWFSVTIFANQRLNETLRFGMLEVQEHLETFLDRKDHATEVGFAKILNNNYLKQIVMIFVFPSVLGGS